MERYAKNEHPDAWRLLNALREARARIETLEVRSSEPLAIVGMACRFPGGADGPEAYWRLLRGGGDAIAEVPKDRWDIDAYYDPDPAAPGKMVCRSGGFLPAVDSFDASFFGIARREAEGMDPQQRLLLEVAWEALEHAGIAPARLRGTPVGVYAAISTFDYAALRYVRRDDEGIDPYFATGGVLSVAAGRLSYVLGLLGPSMSVDTACSSSLVAVHLACRSLRARECSLALAGGVNVILLPELSINFTKAGMLAPDGRCKTFDASADGYVRGEGCGVVVLKRLTDALSDGDRIMAVIRGSAVNQDGASGGLTVPSGPSQEAVIRQALLDGGVEASEVGYIEAHGTGTSLGDPIEVGALGRVFGGRPGGDPLWIGSVKTNIGHLEAASGIAALIKAALSLERGEIPAHLHFRRPNPHISWETLPFEIPIETRRWPEGKKRIAGVSSFGFTGTNAHVVLEEGPVSVRRESAVDRPVHLLALSARHGAALKELANRYVTHLESHPAEGIADVCFTANAGRSHFEERAAVVGSTREEIGSGCRAFCEGREAQNVRCGKPESGKIAFLFTGQGSQYKGMGRELYRTAPRFKEVIDRCAAFLEGKLPRTLTELIYGPGGGEELEDTAVQQPALFAVEMALYELWKSWGIEPSLVLGHSIGEYAAACAAGVFSLEEGLGLIAERGRLMAAIGTPGAMVACAATEERVGRLIAPWEALSLAALNGPRSVVISGPEAALEEALSALSREGIAAKRLKVSQAFHSVLMEEIFPAFGKAAEKVVYRPPQLGFVSNLTGDLLSEVGGDYWLGHARSPVRFRQGMETLRREGCGIFVEMGPNPVLLGMGRRCVEGGIWLPSLGEGQDDWRRMLTSLGELYAAGIAVDWRGFDGSYGRNKVVLPTYPFQRRRYWIAETARRAVARESSGFVHPLLGRRVSTAHRDAIFEARLAPDSPSFLGDHRIFGAAVFPATGYVELALAAAGELLGSEALTLEGFSIHRPLVLPDGGVAVQTILHPEGEGYACEIFAEGSPGQWRLHATGRVYGGAEGIEAEDLEEVRVRCSGSLSVEGHYDRFRKSGIDYGKSFQGIETLFRGKEEALGRLRAPPGFETGMTDPSPRPDCTAEPPADPQLLESDGNEELLTGMAKYRLHPGRFDAALQTAAPLLPTGSEPGDAGQENFIPVGLRWLTVTASPPSLCWSHGRRRGDADADRCEFDFCLYDGEGRPCVCVEGLALKRATPGTLFVGREGGSPLSGREGEASVPADGADATLPARKGIAPFRRISPEALHSAIACDAPLAGGERAFGSVIYGLDWVPLGKPGAAVREGSSGQWVIFADEGGLGERTARGLEALGCRTAMVFRGESYCREIGGRYRVNPLLPGDFQRLAADAFGGEVRGVLHLWSLDSGGKTDWAAIEAGKVLGCGSVLHLVQAMSGAGVSPRLYLVTRGAQAGMTRKAGDDRPVAVHQSPLWGLGRVISLEHPEFRSVGIDLDPEGDAGEGDRLLAEVCCTAGDGEDRLAWRGGVRYGARLVLLNERTEENKTAQKEIPRRMGIKSYGILENLIYEPMERQKPGRGEVEIEVEATGLNFRDVLRALGMLRNYENMEASEARFGFECSGRIAAVGEGVEGFKVGHEVIAGLTTAGSLGSYVTVEAFRVVGKPAGMSHGEGATIPLAFLTACYGLERLAKLRRGESVLIHAAAGGVGLAAIQAAKRAGGVIYATASSRKWDHLKSLGVETVLNSRTLDYADEIRALTGGRGVDVVLNSLTGEYIPKNLEILAPGGRFVEIGKIGIWDGAQVKRIRPDVCYHAFDLGDVACREPVLFRELFLEVMAGFEKGEFQPLKRTEFDLTEGERAFRYMAQAKQIGKVVLTRKIPGARVRSDGTYLITGGLGALGMETARWLASRGAKRIVLCGRGGGVSPSTAEKIDALERSGVGVSVFSADVAVREDVTRMMEALSGMPPLRGIVHAAGVLDDGVIGEQTWERFVRVMSPKIDGAWNLWEATRGMSLDFWVCYSSAASILGSPGQGNYAAANAFLDLLAHDLRRSGVRATTINWGPWAGIGMAAVHPETLAASMRRGVKPFRLAEAPVLFDALFACYSTQMFVANIDWELYASRVSPRSDAGFLSRLLEKGTDERRSPKPAIRAKIVEAAPGDRAGILRSCVIDAARRVMGHADAGQIRTDRPLMEQGLDSLMSVELRNLLSAGLGILLPVALLFNYPSVDDLSRHLAELLEINPEHAPPGNRTKMAEKGNDEFGYIDALEAEALETLIRKEISLS